MTHCEEAAGSGSGIRRPGRKLLAWSAGGAREITRPRVRRHTRRRRRAGLARERAVRSGGRKRCFFSAAALSDAAAASASVGMLRTRLPAGRPRTLFCRPSPPRSPRRPPCLRSPPSRLHPLRQARRSHGSDGAAFGEARHPGGRPSAGSAEERRDEGARLLPKSTRRRPVVPASRPQPRPPRPARGGDYRPPERLAAPGRPARRSPTLRPRAGQRSITPPPPPSGGEATRRRAALDAEASPARMATNSTGAERRRGSEERRGRRRARAPR